MASNPPNRLRVMVDANVLFAASAWPRFPYEVLRHAANGDFQLVLTQEIIDEAKDALNDVVPHAVQRLLDILEESNFEEFPTPTDEEVAAYIGLIRDQKDIHVALAAINAHVDYLVTSDKDFTDPNEPIRQQIAVLLPGTFLRHYMGWTGEELEAIRRRNWESM